MSHGRVAARARALSQALKLKLKGPLQRWLAMGARARSGPASRFPPRAPCICTCACRSGPYVYLTVGRPRPVVMIRAGLDRLRCGLELFRL